MPFYLTNEHIEATMERNPDDTFSPSSLNIETSSSKKIKISQLIAEEIINIFEKYTKREVESGLFCKADSFKEDMGLAYLFTFETHSDEYEITYHIPFALACVLEQFSQDGLQNGAIEIKSKIDEEMTVSNKKIFLSLSSSIVACLNVQQDFAFLQDIELINLSHQTVNYEKNKIIKNLHSLTLCIDKKEYELYFQLDNQFNKTF